MGGGHNAGKHSCFFFRKFRKNYEVSAPCGDQCPLLREILDPPLFGILQSRLVMVRNLHPTFPICFSEIFFAFLFLGVRQGGQSFHLITNTILKVSILGPSHDVFKDGRINF